MLVILRLTGPVAEHACASVNQPVSEHPSLLLPRQHTTSWPALGASALLHSAFVLLLPLTAHMADRRAEPAFRLAVRPVVIRVPEHLVTARLRFVPDGTRVVESRPVRTARAEAAAVESAPADEGASEQVSRATAEPAVERRKLQVPEVKPAETADIRIVLLQPEYALTLRPDMAPADAPTALFWSPVIPPFKPKIFVAPGHRTPAARAAASEATLQLPAPALKASDLRAAGEKPSQFLASARSSVSVHLPGASPTTVDAPSIDPVAGDPIAVVSGSPVPLTRELMEVPPANLIAKRAAAAGSGEAGRASSSGSAATASSRPPVGQQVRSSHDSIRRDAAPPLTASTPPAQAPSTPVVVAVGPSTVAAAERSTPATPAAAEPGRRIEHPANGRFDVVVIQTALADIIPESNGVMGGRPVYTVYLQVGDSREWVLHFCAVDSRTVQSGSVVTLGDPRPLAAPYPTVTVLPSRLPSSQAKRVFVHGVIDASGQMGRLRVIGGENAGEAETLLAALTQWHFRPAKRGDTATPVEILLAVPAARI